MYFITLNCIINYKTICHDFSEVSKQEYSITLSMCKHTPTRQ